MSDEECLTAYHSWRSGLMPIMICTSAFTTGNDYPHVCLTVHIKMPMEMSELIQAQGRAGQDGQAAKCYIIPSSYPLTITISRTMLDHKGMWFVHDHVYAHGNSRCLRFGSTSYIDGEGMRCTEDTKNMLCSGCRSKKARGIEMGMIAGELRILEKDIYG